VSNYKVRTADITASDTQAAVYGKLGLLPKF